MVSTTGTTLRPCSDNMYSTLGFSAAQRHRHTAAHTMIVLEGHLLANETVVGPGAYAHFPAGTVMHHAPADNAPCLFVTIFHGPFDVQPAERASGGPTAMAG